jgi:tetratricopeptide (TPR) repeat protein
MSKWFLCCGWMLAVAMLACGCASAPAGPPVDAGEREMFAAASAGQLAFARGAYEQAVEQYRRALARARLQDEPALIGDQAYNLAISLMAVGQLDDARDHLTEAEAALRRGGLPLADVLLVEARLAYRRGEGADAAATRVLDDPQSKASNLHRAQVAILRAEMACDQGNITVAGEQLGQAQSLSAALPGPGVSAGVARVSGRLHLLRGESIAAGEAFDLEARLQRQSHRYPDMSKALLHAGEAYSKAAKPDLAGDRFYRAALSLAAQEKASAALLALDSAAVAVGQTGDEPMARLIKALQGEVKLMAAAQAAMAPHSLSEAGPSTVTKP